LDLFADASPFPPGFNYAENMISPEDERALLEAIPALPFEHFEFHGYTGKRRTVSFGWTYNFEREAIEPAAPMPAFLAALRATAAGFAGVPADDLRQVLVTEYAPHASIGWHRDKGVFGDVIGISLLSACTFRLRRKVGARWERVTLTARPRSAYLLSGAARSEWEHSIPPVETLRFSITFRTLRAVHAQTRAPDVARGSEA
jgi:alkylated DNA repair dioxygenase AlkB